MRSWHDLCAAFGFMTRIPVPKYHYDELTISRASKFFPLVGLVIGLVASALYKGLLALNFPPAERAIVVLCLLVAVTGAFHEDALADAADGFGGGWTRERILEIMRDSRIGSYGATALVLSLLVRFICLSDLTPGTFAPSIVTAHALCRWSTLPLAYLLPAARASDGSGARVAQRVSGTSLSFGTVLAAVIAVLAWGRNSWLPCAATVAMTALTGFYYRRRLAGVTGDCFGATNQLVEISVYVCGLVLSRI